jgi:hypothetical protein
LVRVARGWTALGVVALAVILAACGRGSKSQSGTTTATGAPTTAQSAGTDTAAGSTTTAVQPLTEAQLQSALLTVTDLPTGWSTTPPSPNKMGECQPLVDKAITPAAIAEADFVRGKNVPFLGERLAAYPDDATAARAFDNFQSSAATCNIGQLSVPPLGDRTIRYRQMLNQGGASVVVDTTLIQRGPFLLYTGYGDFGTDTEQLATFTKLAYEKAANTLRIG